MGTEVWTVRKRRGEWAWRLNHHAFLHRPLHLSCLHRRPRDVCCACAGECIHSYFSRHLYVCFIRMPHVAYMYTLCCLVCKPFMCIIPALAVIYPTSSYHITHHIIKVIILHHHVTRGQQTENLNSATRDAFIMPEASLSINVMNIKDADTVRLNGTCVCVCACACHVHVHVYVYLYVHVHVFVCVHVGSRVDA